jgi:hypothetical protein
VLVFDFQVKLKPSTDLVFRSLPAPFVGPIVERNA